MHRIACCIVYALVAVVVLSTGAESAHILGIFMHPALSHFKFFHPVMRGLANAGHQVVVASYFPDSHKPAANYTDLVFREQEIYTGSIDLNTITPGDDTFFSYYRSFYELATWGREACNHTLSSPVIDEIFAIHQRRPFDLVFIEFFNTDCLLGIVHLLGTPFIGLSSCALMPWSYDRIGLPDTPAHIPSQFVGFSERMNFRERAINWWIVKTTKLLYRLVEISDNQLLRKRFGGHLPDVHEIAKRTSLVFVNMHFSVNMARPLPPQLIELGGIHIREPEPLPDELKEFLDNAEHGVIVISWGSMIKSETLNDAVRANLLKAFGTLAQTVLWKWGDQSVPNQPKNVHFRKWLPQKDVLCHPNVKAFMSHGGMMGMLEAIHCGVPVVSTPIYGDQFLNAACLAHRGVATILPYADMTAENILNALRQTLAAKMQSQARNVSKMFGKRIRTPVETAVWWTEYVLETQGAALARTYAGELSWYAYHSVDVLACLAIAVGVAILSIRTFFRVICRSQRPSKVKTK